MFSLIDSIYLANFFKSSLLSYIIRNYLVFRKIMNNFLIMLTIYSNFWQADVIQNKKAEKSIPPDDFSAFEFAIWTNVINAKFPKAFKLQFNFILIKLLFIINQKLRA